MPGSRRSARNATHSHKSKAISSAPPTEHDLPETVHRTALPEQFTGRSTDLGKCYSHEMVLVPLIEPEYPGSTSHQGRSPMIPLLAVALTTTIQSPNVLVIITDDQGYGDLSLHGNPHLQTPHIDQLARESARFERFYVSPLCAPTRASLLTGRYSLRTGVRGVASGEETMRSQEQTLAELFATAGYRSGLFGKWHNGEHFPHDPIGQGFQQFLGTNMPTIGNYVVSSFSLNAIIVLSLLSLDS